MSMQTKLERMRLSENNLGKKGCMALATLLRFSATTQLSSLTYSNAAKYFPESNEMVHGHMTHPVKERDSLHQAQAQAAQG